MSMIEQFYELKDALADKWNFMVPFGDNGDFFDPIRCEVGGYANGATDFILVVDYGNEGIELYWGWETTLQLTTVWRFEALDLPNCERCENHHSGYDSCFEFPVRQVVVRPQELIDAVVAEVERVMAYADPYLPQPPRFADIKSIMELLEKRWNKALPRLEDPSWWPWNTYLDSMDRLNATELRVNHTEDRYTLTWVNRCQGEELRTLQLCAYRDDVGWRIDCHDEYEALEPYRFKAEHPWPKAVACSCCSNAKVVAPDELWLYRAANELWDFVVLATHLPD